MLYKNPGPVMTRHKSLDTEMVKDQRNFMRLDSRVVRVSRDMISLVFGGKASILLGVLLTVNLIRITDEGIIVKFKKQIQFAIDT
jgi:hypothetical protein